MTNYNPRHLDARLFATVVGITGILLAVFWVWLAMVSSMGWSGRSDLQIAGIVLLLLILPVFVAAALTNRAILDARAGRALRASLLAIGSLLCAPISWGLLAAGVFAP